MSELLAVQSDGPILLLVGSGNRSLRKTTDHPSRVRLELSIRCLFVSLVQADLVLCDERR
jgi:hypothetical protein